MVVRVPNAARFVRFAWATLAFTIAVVLWGAYVRATGSGAGCGAHWPLCNGEVLPRSPGTEMAIELTHRITSGLSLVLVVALGVWAWRLFPRGHRVRRAAAGAVLFMLAEALIGAGLVLFGLVASDRSPARAIVLGVHLTNTFLLLAAIALAARFAAYPATTPPAWRRTRSFWLATGVLALCLVAGVSGAIAALGDTLFPAASLAEAMRQDFDATAHALVRLRVHHPWIAVVAAIGFVAFATDAQRRLGATLGRWPVLVLALATTQLAAGAANVLLRAPVWLQLVHLGIADALWVSLVALAAAVLDAEALRAGAYPPTIAAPIGTRALPNGPG